LTQLAEPILKGLKKSGKLLLLLIKIIIPVSCLVAILDFYGVIAIVAGFFTPAMALFGLPGEATIVLLLGIFVNLFAALGVLTTMTLNPQQITVLAVMIGICHELPVETVICSYTGLKIPTSSVLRLLTALGAGLILNIVYSLTSGG
jgi:hypothetical protein